MKKHHASLHSRGFTLIEMLVVITIIAVLAGIAFPVANGVMRRARNVKVQTVVKDLQVAVNGYHTEYSGRFPVPADSGSDTTVNTEDSEFLGALLGEEDNPMNAREVAFIELPLAKNGVGGLSGTEGSYSLVDEWGNPYVVIMDTDGNNRLENPDTGNQDSKVSSGASARLPASVIVYSFGTDGEEQTVDDVTSWAGVRGSSAKK